MNLIILGTILALVIGLMYVYSRLERSENEKATLAKTKVAQEDKIRILESAALEDERKRRNQERDEESKYPTGPSTGELLREDPDSLN